MAPRGSLAQRRKASAKAAPRCHVLCWTCISDVIHDRYDTSGGCRFSTDAVLTSAFTTEDGVKFNKCLRCLETNRDCMLPPASCASRLKDLHDALTDAEHGANDGDKAAAMTVASEAANDIKDELDGMGGKYADIMTCHTGNDKHKVIKASYVARSRAKDDIIRRKNQNELELNMTPEDLVKAIGSTPKKGSYNTTVSNSKVGKRGGRGRGK